MGIEFATFGTALWFFNMIIVGLGLTLLYLLGKAAYEYFMTGELKLSKSKLVLLIVLLLLIAFYPARLSPKLTISSPPNIEQKQYQQNNNDLVIISPEPRTEKLDGFKPLGSD